MGWSGRSQVELSSLCQLKVSVLMALRILSEPPAATIKCPEIESVLEKEVPQLPKNKALKEKSSLICLKRLILTFNLILNNFLHATKAGFPKAHEKKN